MEVCEGVRRDRDMDELKGMCKRCLKAAEGARTPAGTISSGNHMQYMQQRALLQLQWWSYNSKCWNVD